jgi:antitoxin component of MazEF toxin-antitoxin module
MTEEKIEVITGIDIYQSEEKAAIDTQIATAKAYPRDIVRATNDAIAIVTMSKETAESCNYSLPRGGKPITGPSVHMARIIAQEWGNLRVESKVINITATQVVSQAVCFDLQKNYAVKVEVRKNILQNEYENGRKTGRKVKMNEDMITVTGNAANAIAYRNAVFNVIPKSVVDKVHLAAKNLITGNLSSDQELLNKRKKMLEWFDENHGVKESQILEALGLNSLNQVKQDEILTLIGIAQALTDGDATVAETFGKKKNKPTAKTPDDVKKEKSDLKDKKTGGKSSELKMDLP